MPKNTTKPATLAEVRESIETLTARRAAVEQAPLAHETTRRLVRAQFEQAAAGHAAALNRALQFPNRRGGVQLCVPAPVGGSIDLGGLLAAVLGVEPLMAMLEPRISALLDGPTEAARAADLAEIEAELLRVEHLEEDLIEASEADGWPGARRGDARPEIVLRVKGSA
jgi:hypothetical protein